MEINPVLSIAGEGFPWYFKGYLKLFAVFHNFIYLFIYSTISRVTPDDVPPDPDWETQV